MIPGSVVLAEGRLAGFARRDRAEYDHPFQSGSDRRPAPLPSQHAGVTFPIEKLDPDWACRLHAIIDHYTTASKVGPLRTGLSRIALSSTCWIVRLWQRALINRLDLGLYKSEARGPGRFWGNDGEGTEGIVQLVYQDRTSRIYYLEGSHDSRLLPNITGKAVVFLKMDPVKDADGMEAMDSTMVSYTKLDNRILSGLVSLLRPLIERDRDEKVEQRGGDRQSIESPHAATSRPCAV